MRTFSVLASLLASVATLAVAADVDNVLAALSKISSDLKTLNTDVNKISGGVFSISNQLQASVDTVTVDNDILAAIQTANNAQPFSKSDSQRIISAVDNLVAGSNTTITSTIKKAPQFAGLSPVVLSALYQFKADSFNLGIALAPKLDGSVLNQGVNDLNALNSQFEQAIAVYIQSCKSFGVCFDMLSRILTMRPIAQPTSSN